MPEADYTDDLAPSYARVAREIHRMLAEMKVNDRLMSERLLSQKLGVSRVTLRRSLDYFQRQGILRTRAGGGSWLARSVSPIETGKTVRLLGLLVETVENPMIARIVRGLERYASEVGYHVAIAHDYGDSGQQLAHIRRMKSSGIGGVAVYPDTHTDLGGSELRDELNELIGAGIPLVFIDRYVPGIAAPCILSDNFRGSYMATQHMILSGYRQLGLLSFGGDTNPVNRDRRKGFLAALQDHGLSPEPVIEAEVGTYDYEVTARQVVKDWIDASRPRIPFDGLVCMQDNMAYGAYLALREAGVSVPGQVGLMGFDNLNREIYQAAGLELSSVDQPAERIGREVAAKLIAQIEEKDADRHQHVLLTPSLAIRGSCGNEPLFERRD